LFKTFITFISQFVVSKLTIERSGIIASYIACVLWELFRIQ